MWIVMQRTKHSSLYDRQRPLTFSDRHELEEMGRDLNSKVHEYNYLPLTHPDSDPYYDRDIVNRSGMKDEKLLSEQRSRYGFDTHAGSSVSTINPGESGFNITHEAARQIKEFGDGHSGINKIANDPETYRELHYLVNNSDRANVPKLHRGISYYYDDKELEPSKKFSKGSTFKFNMSSTSSDPIVANEWVWREPHYHQILKERFLNPIERRNWEPVRGKKDNCAAVVLHFPEKTQAVQVAPLTDYSGQCEYIAAPGKFKVTRYAGQDPKGVHHVYLQQIS